MVLVKKIRIVVVALICLLFVGLIGLGRFSTARRAEQGDTAGLSLSEQSCRQCHAAVWNEWQQSSHSRAFSDPNVQAAFQHFGFDRKCQSCHAPEPVLVTGLGEEVQLRQAHLKGGVTCLSCHQTPDGRGVAARRTISDAPCRPVQRPELAESRFCGACHNAIYDDWQQTHFERAGKGCRDCHMPPGSGGNGRRSHLCLGGHDPASFRSGAKMDCRRQGEELVVSVTNTGTGHNFPGERHNRVLLIQVIQRNAAGEITLCRQQQIKGITPFRGESSADRIRAADTFEATFPVVDPPVVAEVKLLYKLFPWHSDREALVVHQATL